MYYFDNRQHHLPHVHVQSGGEEAVITIPDGEVLEESIPRNKLKLVQAWLEIHRDELMRNWELAISGEQVEKIEPLR